jgi:hypothetical protein
VNSVICVLVCYIRVKITLVDEQMSGYPGENWDTNTGVRCLTKYSVRV